MGEESPGRLAAVSGHPYKPMGDHTRTMREGISDPTLTIGSLFSGIGGFELGLARAGGMRVLWQVENEKYCRRILERHWPHAKRYGDIREVDWSTVRSPDIVCGGFPCQPVSTAGARKGRDDERWLWPEVARCLRELGERPRWVVLENVAALASRGIGDVLGDLAALGYDSEWSCVSAAVIGAPHLRDRIWIVGYLANADCQREPQPAGRLEEERRRPGDGGEPGDVADAGGLPPQSKRGAGELSSAPREMGGDLPQLDPVDGGGEDEPRIFTRRAYQLLEEFRRTRGVEQWGEDPSTIPGSGVRRVSYGVQNRAHRLRALGNAVVPQIPEWIGRLIVEADRRG